MTGPKVKFQNPSTTPSWKILFDPEERRRNKEGEEKIPTQKNNQKKPKTNCVPAAMAKGSALTSNFQKQNCPTHQLVCNLQNPQNESVS